jgi:hypothetical protein
VAEEMAKCRVDHYQTLNEVHVSVFAKAANKEQSKIEIEESKVSSIQVVQAKYGG